MINRDHCRINYSKFDASLKEIYKKYLPLLPKQFISQYEDLLNLQNKLKKDRVFNAAARMVRLFGKQHIQFITDLRDISKEIIPDVAFNKSPIIIPSPNTGKVIVFPNLILDTIVSEELSNCCWMVCFDVLETFNTTRSKKPKSWSPFNRGWNKIKNYEELTVIRALVRYTNIEQSLTPSQTQNLAASYVDRLKPLKLVYADSPKDYLTMFRISGPRSCMTLTSDKKSSWDILIANNHHPMSLFAYHPHIKGVYCVRERKVVARTLLYEVKKDSWEYGRVFSINGYYMNKFTEALKKKNYKSQMNSFSRHVVFTVPGIYSESHGSYILPMPYMDNVSGNIFCKFDERDNKFIVEFNCQQKLANVSISSTGGLICSHNLADIRCEVCNNRCRDTFVPFDSHHTFCSERCYTSVGYVSAKTAAGDFQLRRESQCYVDYFTPGLFFTCKASCRASGGVRVLHDIGIKNGKIVNMRIHPTEYSVNGTKIDWGGKVYCLNKSLFEKLMEKKIFETSKSSWLEYGNLYAICCSLKGVKII